MKRFLVVALVTLTTAAWMSETASAVYPAGLPAGYGVLPYGFYQPYGGHYRNALRNPPYFATSPPVYYGARHARPYGLSPFASLPLVTPGDGYRSRLRSGFLTPQRPPAPPLCNPCVSHSKTLPQPTDLVTKGPVRNNPFVEDVDRIAQR